MTATKTILDHCDCLCDESAQVQTYGKGRVCAERGCKTVLSAYNPDEYCSVHRKADDSLHYWQYRFKVCAVCGQVKSVARFRKGSDVCGLCEKAEQRRREQAKVIALGKPRTCTKCGRTYPTTHQYWVLRPGKDGELRANGRCRKCRNEHYAEHYYQRRYGMSREEYQSRSA